MVDHGRVVVVKEVRKTCVWMERGGVLWRRVHSERVWAGVKAGTKIGAWVQVRRCRVKIRVRIRKHHLPWTPTLLVLVGTHVLLELARLLLIRREIGNALGVPGVGMAS